MSKKTGADAVQANAMGHNRPTDAITRKYVTTIAKLEDEITALRGKIKLELNEAKSDGLLKTAIKGAVKNLRMTEDQRQAKNEVDLETQRITALCADLPLFEAA
jgi:uncharacterized protein (UPF0335 family)